jgi:hypothetical protein
VRQIFVRQIFVQPMVPITKPPRTRMIALGLLWLGLVIYAFWLAPPDRPETLDLIINLSTGKIAGINPVIVALFNLMGIWPLIYSAVAIADGRGQKLWAWPFVAGSFAVGAFALLPYLALRAPNPTFCGKKTWAVRLLDSRNLGVVLAIGVIVLLGLGVTQGDWGDFVAQWQTSRFIHVMSLDFCLLSLLFPLLLRDDMARRGLQNERIFWAVALVPLVGPAIYLALRPGIVESVEAAAIAPAGSIP